MVPRATHAPAIFLRKELAAKSLYVVDVPVQLAFVKRSPKVVVAPALFNDSLIRVHLSKAGLSCVSISRMNSNEHVNEWAGVPIILLQYYWLF